MPTLYELTGRYRELYDAVEDCNEDTLSEPLAAALSQWEVNTADKLAACVAFIQKAEMEAEELDRQAKAKRKAASARTNAATILRKQIFEFMTTTKQTKIKTTDGDTLAIQKNGGPLRVVLVPGFPVNELPEEYRRVTIEPDTEAIAAALKGGAELDFADFAERGTHLRIK